MVKLEHMTVSDTEIDGLKVIVPKMVSDERGTVRELYRASAYAEALPAEAGSWAQINLTRTQKGAIRGLHAEAMLKLVTVAKGAAFGAYVDARPDSRTVGKVVTVQLTPGVQVLVPNGVCNGFQALEDDTEYLYFFDQEWLPGMPGLSLSPVDPGLGIAWPIAVDPANRAQISEKDLLAPSLKEALGAARD